MAVTQNTYTGNGATVLYSFTFPYLETTDVKVTINGTPTTAYTFANATTIQFNTAPANGAAIRIYRDTDDASLAATFYSGSAIRAQDLNDNFTQNLYVTQEVNNNSVNIDGSNPMVGPLNMNGFQITNLPVPAVDTNAATKKYVDDRFGNLDIPGHTRWRKVATASQTIFSGTGDYGGVLAYSPTREQVYINGALQQRGVDYAADNGTSVIFTVGLTVGDVVDIICVNNLTNSSISNAGNITYSGQFTGQTARTVAAKLGDVVSVKDFGAVGDGVTDDTAAIQAALAANREVYFPAGTYNYSGTLTPAGNTIIRGAGAETTRLNFTNAAADCISFEGLNLSISDLSVVGGQRGIRIGVEAGNESTAGREALLNKVYFINNGGVGIDIQYGWSNHFNNCKVYGSTSSAVRFGTGFVNSIKFTGLRTDNIGGQYTVHFVGSHYRSTIFDNCIIEGNSTANSKGFYSGAAQISGVSIAECYFETHLGAYIDFSASEGRGVIVSGCDFVGGNHPAILGPYGITIIGCNFTGDTLTGITNPNSCVIFDCHSRDSAGSYSAKNTFSGTITNCLISNPLDDTDGIGTRIPPIQLGRFVGSDPTTVLSNTKLSSPGWNTLAFRHFDNQFASLQFNHTSGEFRDEAGYAGWGGFRTFYTGGVKRLEIEIGGNTKPGQDNYYALGVPATRWSTVYAATGTINTSDERVKQDIEDLSDAELRVAIALKGLVKKYRFKDAVEVKNADARIHVGVIAQEVVSAFQAEGLDPMRYGIVCYDQWKAADDTPAGDRYGIRYEELLAFIIATL